jgi:hypothetical protein
MEARFLTKVIKCENGCWEWTFYKDKDGYGIYKQRRAHRVAYELWKGKIPVGQLVRHKCDNPPCVNPEHLEIGTQSDNMRDMVERGRHRAKTCSQSIPRGEKHANSKLTEDDVREIRILRGFGFTFKELGNMYGICRQLATDIVYMKRWKHV